MGYGFMPYAVDLDVLRRAVGSKDEALLTAVIASQELPDDDADPDAAEDEDEDKDEEDEDDEDEEDEDENDDEEGEAPSSQDAVRHIIMGEPFAAGFASQYGYALKNLCGHLGEMLPNDMLGQTGDEFNGALDGVLDRLKMPAKLFRVNTHLLGRKDPVPLPKRDDFPYIGHLTAAEVTAVAAALAALDPAAVRAAATGLRVRRGEIEPDDIAECLNEILDWCQTCAAAGRGLVTFYH